ncbi:hypothetical protein AGMMS50225_00620 [Betaproteobacteria bacterium]|nr:hypothetical protein AGMMS50225_00620 [Betaproteobacteria bacterium]
MRNPMRTALFPFVALCLVSPLTFADSRDQDAYVLPDSGGCAVWAPSTLKSSDEYTLRYNGGCHNGRAEGRGKAEWLYRSLPGKVRSSWVGEFRNGVFLNAQAIEEVEPLPGDTYIVPMGTVGNARLLFISRSERDGPVELCRVESLRLEAASGTRLGDDDSMKKLVHDTLAHYRKTCPHPQGSREFKIGIHAAAFKPLPNNILPNPQVEASVNPVTGAISYYVNSVANDLRQEKARTDHRQQQEESRQRFLEFTRKNAIHAWVTLRQLDENPFRWENKTVGLVVRLDTMLTRDSALIHSGMRNEGGYAYLSGITPEFPGSENSVLLAVQVGVREKPTDERAAYVNLRHIDSRLCERAACADWFMWGRTQDVNWGQPFQPR